MTAAAVRARSARTFPTSTSGTWPTSIPPRRRGPRPRRRSRSGCPSSPSIAGRLGKSPQELLAALQTMFDIDLRAVAAVGVREQPVRRGRAGGASARDEAGGRGARHGVRGGMLLGAPGDPDDGSRQAAQVDRAGNEARALSRVPGRDAAPQAAHAGRRRGEGRRRGGRDGARRRRGPRRAVQRRPAVSDHQAVDGRVGPPGPVGVHAAPAGARARRSRQGVRRRSSARSRRTSARWARRWPRR